MAGVHAMMMNVGSAGSIVYVDGVYLKPNGVTIAAVPNAAIGTWHVFGGKDYYVAVDYDDLVSVVSIYKNRSGSDEVLANLTRDGQTKSIPLNQVVTTFVEKLSGGAYSTGLFFNATTFNQRINSWDTSNVTDMSHMFYSCSIFNQDIGNWNVSSVTNMTDMFTACTVFNQDISNWNVSNVTNMMNMVNNCRAFNQDIGKWNTSNVTDMYGMFGGCNSFFQNISGWCVSKISKKPTYFDYTANPAWTEAMKPKWGAPCS